MRLLKFIFVLSIVPFLFACEGETSSGTSSTNTDGTEQTGTVANSNSQNLPTSHNCTIANEVLEGNQFWIREEGILVVITADSSTLDPDYGSSHRVLEVYDTKTCQRVRKEVLPVNLSPDFPYFLAEIAYNNNSKLVGIRGARSIYIYAIDQEKLLPELKPQYLSERLSEDAQSGNILRLEVWENYLIGFAEDEGAFAFDISRTDAPEAILPIAEFQTNENEYIPLFAFPSPDGKVQLSLPDYEQELDQFSINALFSDPQELNTSIQASARDNRYIVLRRQDEGRTATAIDMQNRQLLDLPENIASQPTQAVLQWARQQ